MTTVKRYEDGYYLCRFKYSGYKIDGKKRKLYNRNYRIRYSTGYVGSISLSQIITFPKELAGKKIRIKVEVLKDE